MKVTILGSGLVGAPMALDLASDERFEVLTVDGNPEALLRLEGVPSIQTLCRDLSQPDRVRSVVKDSDYVINALPGCMGYATLQAVIAAGKNIVDISFFPEDPFTLHESALAYGVTAVVDCGVAPGMSNLLVGFADAQLDETSAVRILVGGLPEIREWPFEYKAVFSPIDVLEEYTRPARYIQNGRMVVKPALSEPERIDFDRVGTLVAFNTDGLRTLARTIQAPDMIEKTLRYPGHIELMEIFREAGFFNRDPIVCGADPVIPLNMTAAILADTWKLKAGERDITVMRIEVDGIKDGRKLSFVFDLLDRYDEKTGVHSMARTTGYTATVALRLLAAGLFPDKGIVPPEFIGRKVDCVENILKGLKERGVVYRRSTKQA